MGLFVKRYDTGETVQVKKYIIDLHENEESIWSNAWYGRHVIGRHCEWCEGKETPDEQSNCIKPAVSSSVCDEFGNEICLKCYPPFPECDKCPHQPKKQTDC